MKNKARNDHGQERLEHSRRFPGSRGGHVGSLADPPALVQLHGLGNMIIWQGAGSACKRCRGEDRFPPRQGKKAFIRTQIDSPGVCFARVPFRPGSASPRSVSPEVRFARGPFRPRSVSPEVHFARAAASPEVHLA